MKVHSSCNSLICLHPLGEVTPRSDGTSRSQDTVGKKRRTTWEGKVACCSRVLATQSLSITALLTANTGSPYLKVSLEVVCLNCEPHAPGSSPLVKWHLRVRCNQRQHFAWEAQPQRQNRTSRGHNIAVAHLGE